MTTRKVWIVGGLLAIATPAAAGELADAIAKSDPAAVAALRARRDEAAARCTLGVVYARRRDLARADLYLTGCEDLALPDEIAGAVAKTARDVKQRLSDGDLSPIEIVTRPEGLPAVISALPAEPVTTPARVWVKAGTYTVTVTTAAGVTFTAPVTAGVRSRAAVVIDASAARPPSVKPGRVDFEQEQAAEPQQTAPPPAVKRPSLIPGQYQKRTAATGPGLLEDPLAT
ncbi:MAG: hypothetical protein M3680_18765, partial [Myxococcota bacterium]|nr:hypothetical protein [Myxococcota bacterium]